MKARLAYVSNSSSCSFLVPRKPDESVMSIKLPNEIWKAIEKNHIEWNGNRFDLSSSDEWWLTEMVSDCQEEFTRISDIPNAITYLEGNDMPYGCYSEGGEKNFIIFKKDGTSFYVLASDFVGENGEDDIPDSIRLREGIRRILQSGLNRTQKINAIRSLFDF